MFVGCAHPRRSIATIPAANNTTAVIAAILIENIRFPFIQFNSHLRLFAPKFHSGTINMSRMSR